MTSPDFQATVDPQLVRQAQLRMLELLEAIDAICQRHKLCWFLAYGTLLGAVRHQGFIPWDDDCDIFMPRADYEAFAKLAATELPANMFLQTRETEPSYKRKINKVRLRGTKLVEFDEGEDEPYCQGIFVDIFVGDYYPAWLLPLIKLSGCLHTLRWNRKRYAKGSFKRHLYGLAIALPACFLEITKFIFVQLSKIYRMNDTLPYMGKEARQCTPEAVHPTAAWFPPRRDLPFEGRYFPVPNDCHTMLQTLFGDYMTPPPPENRLTHAKKIEP